VSRRAASYLSLAVFAAVLAAYAWVHRSFLPGAALLF
jgi:hypothetical protein